MQITAEEARTLVNQLQIAHKLLAGFYQNIMAIFNRLAENSGYDFGGWSPSYTDRPCRAQTNPSTKWIWDFLPLYASFFEYKKIDNSSSAQPGDCILAFRLFCDEGFKAEYRKGYVDPVDLESKEGSVEVMIYRCIKGDSNSCYEIYGTCEWCRESPEAGWQKVGHEKMVAYYKRYPLDQFIMNQEPVQALITNVTAEKM